MSHTLRPYQEEAIKQLCQAIEDGFNPIFYLPTGGGKTASIINVLDRLYEWKQNRVIFICQSIVLVDNFYESIQDWFPEWYEDIEIEHYVRPTSGVVRAHKNEYQARLIVSTRQTLASNNQRKLHKILEYGSVDTLVIDEAHHGVTTEYMDIIQILKEQNPNLRIVGLTATPMRNDDLNLSDVFNKLISVATLQDLVEQGWLKDIEAYKVNNIEPDAKDSPAAHEHWLTFVYEVLMNFDFDKRHALHFFSTVEKAEIACRAMQEKNIPSVMMSGSICIDLDGKTHYDYQDRTAKDHRIFVEQQLQSGEVTYCTNVSLMVEGYNWNICNMVLMSTPADDIKLTQALGRGTRLPKHVVNLKYDKLEDVYHVQYRDGTTFTGHRSELDFFPTTIFIDFSDGDATILSFIEGLTQKPVKQITENKVKVRESEEDFDEVTQKPVYDYKLMIENQVAWTVAERPLLKAAYGRWYQDPSSGSLSLALDDNYPYGFYLMPPLYNNLAALNKILDKGIDSTDNNDNIIIFNNLIVLKKIIAKWSVWLLKNNQNYGSNWNQVTPFILLDDKSGIIQKEGYTFINTALGDLNQYIEYFVHNVDVPPPDKKKYKNRSNRKSDLPSASQLTYLENIEKKLIKKGYKMRIPKVTQISSSLSPRFIASQMIGHYEAYYLVNNYLRKIKNGDIKVS